VTLHELDALLEQFRTGLEAEIVLVRQLEALAERQTLSSTSRNFEQLATESDERDRLTRSLVAIEEGLTHLRECLSTVRTAAASRPTFSVIVELRRQAADAVGRVLSADRESLKSLADAEMARRAAMAGLEKGETTLAAYRRVLTPPVEHAALLDRRG
jgi:hypothetical protein